MPIFLFLFFGNNETMHMTLYEILIINETHLFSKEEKKKTDDITLHIYAIIIYIFLQYELRPTTLLFSTLR